MPTPTIQVMLRLPTDSHAELLELEDRWRLGHTATIIRVIAEALAREERQQLGVEPSAWIAQD
mgnify:CR=1 FL=1